MQNRTPRQVSFSFTEKDSAATDALLKKISVAGLKARRGAVIRALLTFTSEANLFEVASIHARAFANPATMDPITDHPPADLPQSVLDRVDRVVTKLAQAGIAANRSYVLRALVRATKPDDKFVSAFAHYLDDNPYKPRGLSKLRLEAKRCKGES